MKIKEIMMQNFKGCKQAAYTFDGKDVTISGANGSGKTTIFDAVTWILFGKDSLDNAKFEVRPLDINGEPIHNVDIVGSVTFIMEDGNEVELKKTQRENWVKKRGSENPILQGNVNSFEIDGYPKSEKEFKEYVNGIVDADLFKMLTNPTYFPNMPWKEQRAVIMKLAMNVPDVELAKGNEAFEPLINELIKAPSTDDINAKYQKIITELKKTQKEIPVRIDELSNSKSDVDVSELELLRNSLNEEISTVKGKIADNDKLFTEYQKLSDGIMKLKFKEGDLSKKANESILRQRSEIEGQISDKQFLVKKTNMSIAETENNICLTETKCDKLKSGLNSLRDEWSIATNREFDENSFVCPYCKQEYPTDKKEVLLSEFEAHKHEEIESINAKGNSIKESLNSEKEKLLSLEEELKVHKKSLDMLDLAILELESKLSELPTSVDISDTDEYKELQLQISEKEKAMEDMNNAEYARNVLNAKLDSLQSQLIDCEKKIALSAKNVEIDERISELQAELKEVGAKVADAEKMQYLLGEFIKYKLDLISESINSMFDGVDFKLFDIQLNGGIKEVCECTVNGVPYGSLNNGHRIIAGLDIIKALQKTYNAHLPIFIDNAEAVNDFNIPKMECQLIKLVVADNKDLIVE